MKRTIALVLAAMMLLSVLLSGCGDNSTSSAVSSGSSVATGDAANADPDNPYANLDLSKTENIVTYVVGSEPNAIAEVMAQVNEKTKAAIKKSFQCQLDRKGFSMVEVLSTCPTNWGKSPIDAIQWLKENMMAYYPVGVYVDKTGEGSDGK